MKRMLATAIALGVGVVGASATPVEFRGGLCITSVTTQCSAFGWAIGDCLLMRYSPPNLGTNGAATEFSLLGQSYGDNYSLASGSLVGTSYQSVVGIHVGRTG